MQTKATHCQQFKISTVGANNIARISGYASVFGGVDSYGDMIKKGAYSKTLADRNWPVLMKFNHFGEVIGKWTEIREDETGLWVEGELTPNHSVSQNVEASLRHGAIAGLSIGYIPTVVKEGKGESGNIRLLEEIELVEISVVDLPADKMASVSSIKNEVSKCEAMKDVEKILRQKAGLSQADATAIVAAVKRLSHSDCDVSELSAMFDSFKI